MPSRADDERFSILRSRPANFVDRAGIAEIDRDIAIFKRRVDRVSDVALREMARAYPTTLAAFGRIPGVGQQKLRDFGEPFTVAIAEFLATQSRQHFANS